jgi:hypothetical protein
VASGHQYLSIKMKSSRSYNYPASGGTIYIAKTNNENGTLFAKSNAGDDGNGVYVLGKNEFYMNYTGSVLRVPIGILDAVVVCDYSDVVFNNENYIMIIKNILSYKSVNSSNTDYSFMNKVCGFQGGDMGDIEGIKRNVRLENGVVVGVNNLDLNDFDVDIENGTVFTTGDVIINKNDTLMLSAVEGNIISINSTIYNQIYQRIKFSHYAVNYNKITILNILNEVYNSQSNHIVAKNSSKLLFHSLTIYGILEFSVNINIENIRNSSITMLADTVVIKKGGSLKGSNFFPNFPVHDVRAAEFSTYGSSSNGKIYNIIKKY